MGLPGEGLESGRSVIQGTLFLKKDLAIPGTLAPVESASFPIEGATHRVYPAKKVQCSNRKQSFTLKRGGIMAPSRPQHRRASAFRLRSGGGGGGGWRDRWRSVRSSVTGAGYPGYTLGESQDFNFVHSHNFEEDREVISSKKKKRGWEGERSPRRIGLLEGSFGQRPMTRSPSLVD